MKFLYLIMIMIFMFGCSEQTDVSKKALDKDEYDILYTIGVEVSQQVKVLGLNAAELQAVQSGFSDNILENQLQVDTSQHRQKLQEWGSKRIEAAAMRYSKQGEEYVKKFLEDPSIKKTVSGALIKDISAGTGKQPTGSSRVKIHYHGTLVDGTVFDSSKDRKEPGEFALGGLIKCWGEGIPQMKVGGTARLVCPPETAYGENGSPPVIPPNSTLIFDVELLEILDES